MQVQGNTCLHFSPGQEDKRGRERERERERGWDRYLGEKEKKEEEEEEGGWGESKKEKTRKEVDCFLDEWESTVVHEQENRASFFAPPPPTPLPSDRQINTPKQKPGLESKSYAQLCTNLGFPIVRRRKPWYIALSFSFFCHCVAFQTF